MAECNPNQPAICAPGTCVVPDVTRRFRFRNDTSRRRLSLVNEEALTAPRNILFLADMAFAMSLESAASAQGSGGICPDPYPGPANISGAPLPFAVDIAKGETLIVEARVLGGPPEGFTALGGGIGLSSALIVNGTVSAVTGDSSASGVGGTIDYSYKSE
jgi:hypothetical protein